MRVSLGTEILIFKPEAVFVLLVTFPLHFLPVIFPLHFLPLFFASFYFSLPISFFVCFLFVYQFLVLFVFHKFVVIFFIISLQLTYIFPQLPIYNRCSLKYSCFISFTMWSKAFSVIAWTCRAYCKNERHVIIEYIQNF